MWSRAALRSCHDPWGAPDARPDAVLVHAHARHLRVNHCVRQRAWGFPAHHRARPAAAVQYAPLRNGILHLPDQWPPYGLYRGLRSPHLSDPLRGLHPTTTRGPFLSRGQHAHPYWQSRAVARGPWTRIRADSFRSYAPRPSGSERLMQRPRGARRHLQSSQETPIFPSAKGGPDRSVRVVGG